MLSQADLAGAWELVDFRVEFDDGREPIAPFGVNARGSLIYSTCGRMSGVLSSGERDVLSASGLEASHKAPAHEKAAAFDTYLSYAGRYSVQGNQVTHHVDLALVPNIVGADQVRDAALDGDELTLTYTRDSKRGKQHYCLRWRRA